MRMIDLTGKRYGKLTVIGVAEEHPYNTKEKSLGVPMRMWQHRPCQRVFSTEWAHAKLRLFKRKSYHSTVI